MQSVPPVIVVDLFPEERAHLLRLLAGLSADEWGAPTACAGWSVKDVALHLLGGNIGNLSRRRDGFADPSFARPGEELSHWPTLVTVLNRWNELWVQAARRISPRLLCDLLGATGEALDDYFRSLDLYALGGPVGWAGPQPAPVWLDVAREYTERWLHQQHIRDAVGQSGLTERRFFAPVLATFAHALPHTLRHVAAPDGTRVRLVVTGEAGGAWEAISADGQWRLSLAGTAPAAATVTLDGDTAWRLFTRGLTDTAAMARAQISGDRALAAPVFAMVSIIA